MKSERITPFVRTHKQSIVLNETGRKQKIQQMARNALHESARTEVKCDLSKDRCHRRQGPRKEHKL